MWPDAIGEKRGVDLAHVSIGTKMRNRLFRSHSSPSLTNNKISPSAELYKHLNPIRHSSEQRVVLIDWDGCLEDSSESISTRLKLVRSKLNEQYNDLDLSDELLLTPWTREFDSHMKLVFGAYAQEAGVMYKHLIQTCEITRKTFTGSTEFLQQLRDAAIPFAIVTNAWRECIETGIKAFGWNELLKNIPIITSDDAKPKEKPHPHHFKCAMQQLGMNIDKPDQREIIVIGDGIGSDMVGALKLSELGFRIRAVWINHGKDINCKLGSYDSFQHVAKDVFKFSLPFSKVI